MMADGRLTLNGIYSRNCRCYGMINGVFQAIYRKSQDDCITKVFEALNGIAPPAIATKSPKDQVLDVVSRAYCMGGRGGEFPWEIHVDKSPRHGDHQVIGKGRSGAAAWRDAAKALATSHS